MRCGSIWKITISIDETTDQSTKPSKYGGKVAGYNPARDAGQVIDETTSHLTKAASCQVIGYGYSHSTDETTSHPTQQPKDGCQVVGYRASKNNAQVAG